MKENKKYSEFKTKVFNALDEYNKLDTKIYKERSKINTKYENIDLNIPDMLKSYNKQLSLKVEPLIKKQDIIRNKCITLIGTCDGEVVDLKSLISIIEKIYLQLQKTH